MTLNAVSAVPKRLATLALHPSVWLEFTPLAAVTRSVNLGQGFPDWEPPSFVLQAAARAAAQPAATVQQYARSRGHPQLAQVICEVYGKRRFGGRVLNPQENVLVTNGASGAIYLALVSLVDEGDEVLLVEPAFDIYFGAVKMAGGTAKHVPLRPRYPQAQSAADLELDDAALEAAITPRTRVLLLNTPHNPTGKVMTRDELEAVAAVIRRYPQVTVVSDEVYEHLVYDGARHVSMASLPGMFERCLSIFSAGKTFSVTGWKIGWVIGGAALVQRLHNAQQFVVFSVCTPMQAAVAECLEHAERTDYYAQLARRMQHRRDQLLKALRAAHLQPLVPQGGYFVVADGAALPACRHEFPEGMQQLLQEQQRSGNAHGLEVDERTRHRRDYNLARWMSLQRRVTPIPLSVFYGPATADANDTWLRFAFCKRDEMLEAAAERLRQQEV
ncbi:hypothetical protein CDCA_CDCA12G3331 [Cyanidium caldarium]|uniref:Aminotransferase class I/classII large domain-containing protein n=1 Tax=Cyanidium caldarium TaxID=2771 RepID=A0AAV9IYU2_CYACA|nr:hypothetical protein CDCA_CDCA12G3331 [Cyanidium caldarium]